jgi:CBS domain-containing protein
MPTAGEFCNRSTVIARKGEPILDVARRMRDEHVGSVVVVEEPSGRKVVPVGIVTDRDLVVRVLAATDRHVHTIHVSDIMSEDLVKAWDDEDLVDVVKRMRSFGIRRVPVVDREDNLQGIIALDDLVDFLQEQVSDLGTLLSHERKREEQSH